MQRKQKEKLINTNKGITLVALIITVIILLILAGVTISSLTSNGLFEKTQDATSKFSAKEVEEKIKLAIMESIIEDEGAFNASTLKRILEESEEYNATVEGTTFPLSISIGGQTATVDESGNVVVAGNGSDSNNVVEAPTTVAQAISQEYVFDGTEDPVEDLYGNKIKVPKGFQIKNEATTVDKGIVIIDVEHTNTAGSEFVWVPVTRVYKNEAKTEYEDITLGRFDFNNSTGATSAYSGSYKEDDGTYDNTRAKDLSAFKISVSTNKGYYIGRYEAGVKGTTDNSTYNTSKDSTEYGQVVTTAGVCPWNIIRQPYAATVCQNMYEAKAISGVESDLINSYAWDTAIDFIRKCGDNSKYAIQKGISIVDIYIPQVTGANSLKYDANGTQLTTNTEKDVQCNIYDMAGNVLEWSTETSDSADTPCVFRGGDYFNNRTTSDRSKYGTRGFDVNFGFRPLLYL